MNNIITQDLILLDKTLSDKEEAIAALAQQMNASGRLNDMQGYIDAVKDREAVFPTAMGFSIAIPHGKTDAVKQPSLAFLRLNKLIDWSEDEKVKYIFLIAVPSKNSGDEHLRILASLSRQLIHEDFREKLMTLKDANELMNVIKTI